MPGGPEERGGRLVRWATRRGCHVDRTACVWLIKRYLDPEAEFYFFADPTEAPGALRRGWGAALASR